MIKPVKFLFDDCFDEETKEQEVEALEDIIEERLRAEFQKTLEDEKKQSYELGFKDGELQALGGLEADIDKSLRNILSQSQKVTDEFNQQTEDFRNETIMLALSSAKQLAKEFVAHEPLEALEALFTETLNYIQNTPRIVVQVPEELVSETERRLKSAIEKKGYTGDILVQAQSDMERGDWQFEWLEGGVVKKQDEISQSVTDAIQRYMAARQGIPLSIEDFTDDDDDFSNETVVQSVGSVLESTDG